MNNKLKKVIVISSAIGFIIIIAETVIKILPSPQCVILAMILGGINGYIHRAIYEKWSKK